MKNSLTVLGDVLTNVSEFAWDHALFMPHGVDWVPSTTCAILDPDDFENEANPERPQFAVEHSLHYALGVQVVQGIVENARLQRPDATVSDLVDAFIFYYDNDAYVDWS
ncbi:DUF7716 domain-containing protein [Burkholderia glumae]|uniref:DUF7716 domain-containing protein n=1 Tax=Burkholderia glumae TaxID=337 RepID=A0AAQ0BVH7_BURGL|nr:hypothetical protein [Burkholderia glumae]AJY62585.1 hypothetical protein KS03_5719 [Burkholderia glumae LMG 2196 = ATCC 33617]QGA41629.1 hypothetical protein GAS19_29490 [Burkholderia glumae]QPQ94795.1 hypothetical protein I6H06_29760 [Burkholderia glumae]QQM89307.1 hypothetical protein I6G78_00805 [Burkholderia glumae]